MKSIGEELEDAVLAVTADWAKQRKREERDRSAVLRRRDALIRWHRVTFVDAANECMERAYLKVSDGGERGRLPAKARQIMYAARPYMLAATGKEVLRDQYFCQTLLPDYLAKHLQRCAGWDIVWDARGSLSEPHTGIEVPLGTIEVRQYLAAKPGNAQPEFSVDLDRAFPTHGPEHRYDTVLFIEKEGFEPLLKAAAIADRFDVATMSTKGMSVTAARFLVEELSKRGVGRILVLHDFDVSGFSIFGTFGSDTRRYQFQTKIPLIDIGLRLHDVEALGLESEPVVIEGDWEKRAATLRRHGATADEIDFLAERRVELNAMTSRQLVDFIEAKFAEHGVEKLIPDDAAIAQHARRVIEQQLAEKAIAEIADKIAAEAKAAELPTDLRQRVEAYLAKHPRLSWDAAVAQIIAEEGGQ